MTVLIFLGSLLGAMALGIPIAYSLLVCGVALMWHLDLFDAQILAQNVINGADSFPLLAVPFFMLAGEIMNVGGLSRRIVKLAMTLVGHVRGGLGYVAILAAVLMAALSGSAVADTAALAALLLPMMVAAGHDKARSGGLLASAGIIAPIIPPSIGFVIFGVAANVSIGKLFLAGIVPGLLMGVSIALTWWYVARKENVTPPPKATGAEKLKAFKDSTWALVLPVIVLVGLKFGVFTPTEAAVVAAVYSLVVGLFVYRELSIPRLPGLMLAAAGHDKARAGGLLASAGIIAPIIPPSIGFVIFGVAANVSIGKLFLAGIVPGLLMGVSIALTWWYVARKENVTPPPKATRAEKLKALRDSTWALVLPVIVLVGLKFGVFTPTEAAVVAAVYALFVSTVVYREMGVKEVYEVFVAAARTTAVIMFLVAAAMVSAWLITVADIPSQMIGMLQPFMDSPTLLLVMIMLLVMAVGTAMDMTPTILIMTPVLMPVVKAAGIDPVYFGVLFIMNNAIGLVTPPVGTVLNVVAGVGKMKMDDVTKGVIPFVLAEFAVMFLLVLFPSIVLVPLRWLTN